jgi:hypothetical protein
MFNTSTGRAAGAARVNASGMVASSGAITPSTKLSPTNITRVASRSGLTHQVDGSRKPYRFSAWTNAAPSGSDVQRNDAFIRTGRRARNSAGTSE